MKNAYLDGVSPKYLDSSGRGCRLSFPVGGEVSGRAAGGLRRWTSVCRTCSLDINGTASKARERRETIVLMSVHG